MCRKWACVCSVVLVLGVVLTSVSRAELLAHWTFDEGSGTMIQDSSGNDHDGAISGTPQWVPGMYGGALDFHNTVGAEVPNFDPTGGTGSFSVAFWCNWEGVGGIQHFLTKSNGWAADTMVFQVECKGLGNSDPMRDRRLHLAYQSQPQAILHVIPDNEWSHNTLVFDGAAGTATGYLNGVDIEGPQTTGIGQDVDSTILIGVAQPLNRIFQGSIDDMWLFSHVLSQSEIQQLMMGGISPGQASNPNPADEATDVSRVAQLTWTPGEFAPADNGHIVYFSESFGDVNDGVGGIRQSASSYDPGRLEFGTTYYWRVDEVNAPPDSTVHPGAVWSFTTEPVGYPVDGASITATASSIGQAEFGPEKTIDGSGLDENGLHSTSAENMWLSGSEPQGAWIQYEFDKMQKLHQMWVWNSNQMFEALYGFGCKDVTVEHSVNGTDWTAVADVPQFTKAPGAEGYAHDITVGFGGVVAKYVKLTATSNWGGILPQFGLSEVRFLSIPVSSRDPSPDSGAAAVDVDAILSWRAGREAVTHNLYISTDQQAVIEGNALAVSVTDTSYSSALDLGSTYYWRVDEVNEAETPATWQSDVWSFSTSEYLVVDDFESYNDIDPPDPESHRIFESWIDGYDVAANGALVGNDPPQPSYAEKTIVHNGKQSMPLFYGNTGGATYSEATLTFAAGQDWTRHGIKTLGLWFYGTAGNTGQLYVKINGVKIPYDSNASNLAIPNWQPWNIDLTALGVEFQSVTTLAIGIDGNAAAGTLYIDDIRLYAYDRQLTTPVEPDPVNLAGHWQLDGNLNDSSGNGRHGAAAGGPIFTAGKTGQAIELDGVDDYVTITGYKGVLADAGGTQQPFTLTAWVKTTDSGDRTIASWGTNTSMLRVDFRLYQGRLRVEHGGGNVQGDTTLNDSNWHHVALIMNQGATVSYPDVQLWLDGKDNTRAGTDPDAFSITADVDMAIGYRATAPARYFLGAIDDVRLYDRVLTEMEMAWLTGRTLPFDEPF